MTCRRWRELSTTDFGGLDKGKVLVVLPIGSTEQHGPHLPVGTDSLIVEAVVEGVLQRQPNVDCLFLPTVWCSKSNEHTDFPGTVVLAMETLVRVLNDIAESVAGAGFHKMVFMNAHGGNTDLLGAALRDIRQRTGLLTFGLEQMRFYAPPPQPKGAPAPFDIHAGYYETSVLLARYPQLMAGREFAGLGSDRDRGKVAASFSGFKYLSPEGRPVNVPWLTNDYTDDGVVGNPAMASAADGARELDRLVDTICEVLQEIAAFEYRIQPS